LSHFTLISTSDTSLSVYKKLLIFMLILYHQSAELVQIIFRGVFRFSMQITSSAHGDNLTL
jgi:hypothetical protein